MLGEYRRRLRAQFSHRRIARSLVAILALGLINVGLPSYTFALPAQNSSGSNLTVGSGQCQSEVSSSANVSTNQVDGECIVIIKSSSQTSSTDNSWTAPANVTEISILLIAAAGIAFISVPVFPRPLEPNKFTNDD